MFFFPAPIRPGRRARASDLAPPPPPDAQVEATTGQAQYVARVSVSELELREWELGLSKQIRAGG